MSWTDTLKGLVGTAEQATLPQLIQEVLGAEGLQAVLSKLEDAGLGDQVSSWLDKNQDSLPITPEQLRSALGDERVQSIATSLGIPADAILKLLAEHLPQVAATAPPSGEETRH